MSNQDELLALAQEINKSDALRYAGRIETLGVNYFVFHRNYEELKKLIDVRNNQGKMLELWDLRNPHQLDIVINELLRLFHNYLASAKSLVDQTRVVVPAWYKDHDFLKEYNDQIASRFAGNPLTGFIEDLRNFSLHYSLPIINATFSFPSDRETGKSTLFFSFVLAKNGLLVWSRWNKGKAYLSKAGDEIDIGELADAYYRQIADFHYWLVKRLQEIHRDDLAWLEEMRQKTINAMSEEERRDRGLM